MFQEISELTKELTLRIGNVGSLATSAGNYLHALALATCYDTLIDYMEQRTAKHPEVQRVPELQHILLAHLLRNADRHIDTSTNRIFNPLILGGPRSLKDWQDAGYHTKRSSGNYPKRLKYWRAIYDHAPIVFQQRVAAGDNLFSEIAYQSTFSTKIPKRKVKEQSGGTKLLDISYEQVIHDRMANYSATEDLVPWWEVLNYGSTIGGLAGYPSTAGLHFVEDAEKLVPNTVHLFSEYFEQFLADMFSATTPVRGFGAIDNWVDTHISTKDAYLPTRSVARALTRTPF